jgi:hypothetical protein
MRNIAERKPAPRTAAYTIQRVAPRPRNFSFHLDLRSPMAAPGLAGSMMSSPG